MTASIAEQTKLMDEVNTSIDLLTDKTQKNTSNLQEAGDLASQVQYAAVQTRRKNGWLWR